MAGEVKTQQNQDLTMVVHFKDDIPWTPTTQLRPIDLADEADVAFMYETRRHPKVAQWLLGNPPASMDAHRRWLKSKGPASRLIYLLIHEGQRAGYCQVYDFTKETVEVGFAVHPRFHSMGLGTEMANLLLPEISEFRAGRKVILYVRPDNTPAARS